MTDSDTTKALVKLGTKFLDTFGEQIQDVVGYFGGDWLHDKREQNRERLKARKDHILLERGVTQHEEVSPSVGVPLLLAAQDESREELQEIWARLLAAIEDPQRARYFRQEFIRALKSFDPLDACILESMFQGGFAVTPLELAGAINTFAEFGKRLDISRLELEVSLQHLESLGCLVKLGGGGYDLSSFGKLLASVVV